MQLPDWIEELFGTKPVLPASPTADWKYNNNAVGTESTQPPPAPQEVRNQPAEPYSLWNSKTPMRDLYNAVNTSVEEYSPGVPHLVASLIGGGPSAALGMLASTEDALAGRKVNPTEVTNAALMPALAGLGVRPTPGMLGTFVGPSANLKLTDREALGQAKTLHRWGADPEYIRQRTGWDMTADGKWRFEISDHGAKVNPDFVTTDPAGMRIKQLPNQQTQLKDILDHPELFEANPDLKYYHVKTNTMMPAQGRAFTEPGKQLIEMNALHPDDFMSTLIHEVQHANQQTYKFPNGSAPSWFAPPKQNIALPPGLDPYTLYRATAGEVEAELVASRLKMTPAERKAFGTYEAERPGRYGQILADPKKAFPDNYTPVDPSLSLKNLRPPNKQYDMLVPEGDVLSPAYKNLLEELILEGWTPGPKRGSGHITYTSPASKNFKATIEGKAE